jgi:hypothetical protein
MEDIKELHTKAQSVANRVGDLLTEENIEVEVVMSVLVSMLISTALSQTNMSPVELIRLFSQAVEKYEVANEEMGESKWLN